MRAARVLHVGDQPAAIAFYEQSIAAATAAGDARTVSEMHGNLAATYADLGQLDQAETVLRQSLADARAPRARLRARVHAAQPGRAPHVERAASTRPAAR